MKQVIATYHLDTAVTSTEAEGHQIRLPVKIDSTTPTNYNKSSGFDRPALGGNTSTSSASDPRHFECNVDVHHRPCDPTRPSGLSPLLPRIDWVELGYGKLLTFHITVQIPIHVLMTVSLNGHFGQSGSAFAALLLSSFIVNTVTILRFRLCGELLNPCLR